MRYFILALALIHGTVSAQALLKPGMTVTTNMPEDTTGDYVVHIFDTRDVVTEAPMGTNWSMNTLLPPAISDQQQWKASRMGSCFGCTIDAGANIYIAAAACYSPVFTYFGSAGAGGIYKIDANDWSVSDFITTASSSTIGTPVSIPNTGNGLGNITYDQANDQLFATNMEDGKIYRISTSGQIVSTFDPFAADNGVPGPPSPGEMLWGIGVYRSDGITRVYFSRWSYSAGFPLTPSAYNTIWSVELDATGEFTGTEQLEYTVEDLTPLLVKGGVVTCINFSSDGKMLIAERSMLDFNATNAHDSRVNILVQQAGIWANTTAINLGVLEMTPGIGANAAGGADFGYKDSDAGDELNGCEQLVWATSDAIKFMPYNPDQANEYVYGIAGISAAGNSMDPASPVWAYSTSYMVDFNNNITDMPKVFLGSCAVYRTCVYDPCEGYECTMLNVITPNGDGKNDLLVIDCVEGEGWPIEIYNRWGNLLYSNDNYENNWDGSPYNDGVYYYIITSPCDGRKLNCFFHLLKSPQ